MIKRKKSFFLKFIKNLVKRKVTCFPFVFYECNFYPKYYSESLILPLFGCPLPESIKDAVVKRKSEFIAGRYLARTALIELGALTTDVKIGSHRAPVWPDLYLGSISHCNQYAVCIVARKSEVTRIGVDVEEYISEAVAKEICNSTLTKFEFDNLISCDGNPLCSKKFTIIFSAKETLFKALYPEVGYYFGFETARAIKIDFSKSIVTMELLVSLTPKLLCGSTFQIKFELTKYRVLTYFVSTYEFSSKNY